MMYLSLTPDKDAMTLGAEVVRLFAHALMGGLLGFAVGLTLHPQPRGAVGPTSNPHKVVLPVLSVAAALIVHFCWDLIAYRSHVAAGLRGVLMLLMLCLMLVWGAMVAYAMDLSRRFMRADAAPAPG